MIVIKARPFGVGGRRVPAPLSPIQILRRIFGAGAHYFSHVWICPPRAAAVQMKNWRIPGPDKAARANPHARQRVPRQWDLYQAAPSCVPSSGDTDAPLPPLCPLQLAPPRCPPTERRDRVTRCDCESCFSSLTNDVKPAFREDGRACCRPRPI